MTTLGALIVSVSQEVGKAVMREVLTRVLKRRWEDARDILVERVRVGDILLEDAAAEEEAVAMLYRYARAANEGAARAALRLMACVMRGEFAQPRVSADSFHRWADVLASLSREEIVVLAELYAQRKALNAVGGQGADSMEAMQRAKRNLVAVAGPFGNVERVSLVFSALMRTGLVMMEPVLGGPIYWTTGLMDELVELIGAEAFADEARAP